MRGGEKERGRVGYKFSFTVYDKDVVEVMKRIGRKRGIFIEVAVREFLKTEKGMNFLGALLSVHEDLELGIDLGEVDARGKQKSKGSGRINFDDFI